MPISSALFFAVATANLLIGLRVLWANPRSALHRSFFLLVLGMGLWTVALSLLSLTQDFIYDKLAWSGYVILFFGLTSFARLFPDQHQVPHDFWKTYIPLALCAASVPFNGIIRGIVADGNGLVHPVLGPVFPFFVLVTVGYVGYAGYMIICRFRESSGSTRMQLIYLATGLLIFVGSFVVFDVLLPIIGIYQLNLIGPASSMIFVLFTSYAIARHHLLDIRVLIQRSIMYSILLGLIVSLYLTLVALAGFLFGNASPATFFLSGIVTAIIGIFGAPVIERYFRAVTDRIFFKGTYDYAEAMQTLGEVMYTARTYDEVVTRMQTALASLFRAEYVHLSLKGKDLDREQAEREGLGARPLIIRMPLQVDDEITGQIEIGPKRSGDAYAPEDLQLLRTFLYQASTALSRTLLYQKVERHAQELERKVQERTRELSDTQERERHMLTELSHNLQTPLTILQSRLDRLKASIPDAGEVLALEQSLARLSSFIYDLLALARLEGAARTEREGTVFLDRLVASISEEIEVIASADDIEVDVGKLRPMRVAGNEKLLREAIMNVASNALKHLRGRAIRKLSIDLSEDGSDAVLSMRDTGPGITPEDLPRIFDRFYRGAQAVGTEGTGLGLTIVKEIVERHGGTVAAESSSGEGATITIRLPLS